jgi:hypothetical protein
LAETIQKIVGHQEKLFGMILNPMEPQKINGYSPKCMHWDGNNKAIRRRNQQTYEWFLTNIENFKQLK